MPGRNGTTAPATNRELTGLDPRLPYKATVEGYVCVSKGEDPSVSADQPVALAVEMGGLLSF